MELAVRAVVEHRGLIRLGQPLISVVQVALRNKITQQAVLQSHVHRLCTTQRRWKRVCRSQ
jgi:hypothetical protein